MAKNCTDMNFEDLKELVENARIPQELLFQHTKKYSTAEIQYLSNCLMLSKNVRKLDLREANESNAIIIVQILKNPCLQELCIGLGSLEIAKILEAGLKVNSTMKTLRLIGVMGSSLGTQTLANALKNSIGVRTLNISSFDILDFHPSLSDVKIVAEALNQNKFIRKLQIIINKDVNCARFITEILNKHPSLQELEIGVLSGGGARAVREDSPASDIAKLLAEGLINNTILRKLHIVMSHDGASIKILLDALKQNKGIQVLTIPLEGLKEVADVLTTNNTLIELHFGPSYIDNEGLVILSSAIQKNTSLQVLNVTTRPDISQRGASALALIHEILQRNRGRKVENEVACQPLADRKVLADFCVAAERKAEKEIAFTSESILNAHELRKVQLLQERAQALEKQQRIEAELEELAKAGKPSPVIISSISSRVSTNPPGGLSLHEKTTKFLSTENDDLELALALSASLEEENRKKKLTRGSSGSKIV